VVTSVLAICGSLRAKSSNLAVLQAAAASAPSGFHVVLFQGLADLPPFNPDLDREPFPASVARFRSELQRTDAVLICSPEYAHGIPGSLKNALDWVVGSGEFSRKPVAAINASLSSAYVLPALTETLRTMDARVVSEACITLPLKQKPLHVSTIISDPQVIRSLQQVLRHHDRRPPYLAVGLAVSSL